MSSATPPERTQPLEASGTRGEKLAGWGFMLAATALAAMFMGADLVRNDTFPAFAQPFGALGRAVARGVVSPFGVGAFLLVFYVLWVGWSLLVQRSLARPVQRLVGIGVGMLAFGAFWQVLLGERSLFPGGDVPIGGYAGAWFQARIATVISAPVAALTCALAAFAGLILATDAWAGEVLRSLFSRPRSERRGADQAPTIVPPPGRSDRFEAAAVGALSATVPAREHEEGTEGTETDQPQDLAAAEAESLRAAAAEEDLFGDAEDRAAAQASPEGEASSPEDVDRTPVRGMSRPRPILVRDSEPAPRPAARDVVSVPRPSSAESSAPAASAPDDAAAESTPAAPEEQDPAIETSPKPKRIKPRRRRKPTKFDSGDAIANAAEAAAASASGEEVVLYEEAAVSDPAHPDPDPVDDAALESPSSPHSEGRDGTRAPEALALPESAYAAGEPRGTEADGSPEASVASSDRPASEDEVPEEEVTASPPPASRPRIRNGVGAAGGEAVAVLRLERGEGVRKSDRYELPGLELLAEPQYLEEREADEVLHAKAKSLEEALADFGVEAQVLEIERGPVITRLVLSLARGTKISKVTGLADDVALTLGVRRVRIAPVKGKSALGVEVPNLHRETVFLRDVATATAQSLGRIAIPLYLGKDSSGQPLVEDLATTPHLLIAGRTGAGKSVFVNSLILSILLTKYPEDVRLVMIDPKKVELEVYQQIPHLLTPVESSPKKAAKILEWAVSEMEERYELLAATGVRHLVSYNRLSKKARTERLLRTYPEEALETLPERLPYIVVIVDELADLMMVAGKEVENSIARLAQKARAVGIHVVLATQRPSTDVITGLIKSNLPARIAFQTRTGIDSRTILDRYGAEKLLDKGDMLYLGSTSDDPRRIQGPFVSDEEVEQIVGYLKKSASPMYVQKLEQVGGAAGGLEDIMATDELFDTAVDVVLTSGQASASFLQRRMQVGYARASRLVDLMADAGLVSEHRGSKAREILVTPEQWEEMRAGEN